MIRTTGCAGEIELGLEHGQTIMPLLVGTLRSRPSGALPPEICPALVEAGIENPRRELDARSRAWFSANSSRTRPSAAPAPRCLRARGAVIRRFTADDFRAVALGFDSARHERAETRSADEFKEMLAFLELEEVLLASVARARQRSASGAAIALGVHIRSSKAGAREDRRVLSAPGERLN